MMLDYPFRVTLAVTIDIITVLDRNGGRLTMMIWSDSEAHAWATERLGSRDSVSARWAYHSMNTHVLYAFKDEAVAIEFKLRFA